ncbi:MAG TPA: CheR family methyltransferase [Terracidiphilus sp.]|jgi:chemotaxis protein methyltransferase WspC
MRSRIAVDPAILQEVVDRLTEAVGIDAESLETGRIAWTIDSRCRHLHLSSATEYLELLRSSSAELDDLIDGLVIQETRFFRDPAVFEHIRVWAEEAAANTQGTLRILSAPCSTGQEAYSVAAILQCAGIPPSGFTIDAFDISRAALFTAARGIYAAGALQNIAPELQSACGVLRDRHWHMHDVLRSRIRFQRRNLAEPSALDDEPGYHLILCRNLLIYLHAGARAVLAGTLNRALLPGGKLIVGAGDRVPELNAWFIPVKPAAGFGFVHKPAAADPKPRIVRQTATPSKAVAARATRRAHFVAHVEEHGVPSTAQEFYRRALDYKDHGNLRQAERRCRQALYLAPNYVPALELLQALWHVHPNPRLRRALSARIERVRNDSQIASAARAVVEEGAV